MKPDEGGADHDQGVWPPAPTVEASTRSVRFDPHPWLTRLATAPLEVTLFAAFASLVSVSELWLTFLGPKMWEEIVFPYTGGSGIMPYGFTLYFAYQMIFAADRSPALRYAVAALLLLGGAFGAYSYLTRSLINFRNPYLTVSPWRPLWTVALPLAWALALSICPVIRNRQARLISA